MNKPFFSFFIAFLFWLLLLIIFSYVIFKKSSQLPISIDVDISTIGEVEQKQNKKEEIAENEPNKNKVKKSFEQKNDNAKKINPLFNPLPEIPEELRKEAFESNAIAKFFISKNGDVLKVELTKACNNPKLNFLLLKSLKKWRFPQQNEESWQEIEVKFRVE